MSDIVPAPHAPDGTPMYTATLLHRWPNYGYMPGDPKLMADLPVLGWDLEYGDAIILLPSGNVERASKIRGGGVLVGVYCAGRAASQEDIYRARGGL